MPPDMADPSGWIPLVGGYTLQFDLNVDPSPGLHRGETQRPLLGPHRFFRHRRSLLTEAQNLGFRPAQSELISVSPPDRPASSAGERHTSRFLND
jgi:hypothetical protein